jgi:hypothetical protein
MSTREPDRIVFLSHRDYVRIKDHHPDLLADDRVTAVPFPLLGGWVADEDLRGVPAAPDTVLLRDPRSGRFAPAEAALFTLALTQAHAFSEVCQLLGATHLRTVEYDVDLDHTAVDNTFTAGLRATRGAKRKARERGTGLTADFAADLRRAVLRSIEASSTFAGGPPDIAGATARAAEHPDVANALHGLISMRSSTTNQLRHHRVQVDFLGETHRQVDLLLDFAKRVSLALPKGASAGLEATLNNRFTWSNDASRQQKLSIEVTFPGAAAQRAALPANRNETGGGRHHLP